MTVENETDASHLCLSILFAALAWLACSSCVGFCAGLLPQLDRAEIVRGNRLPAISYEINYAGPKEPGPGPGRAGAACAENEQLFSDAFVDARRGLAADNLHIEVNFRTEEDLRALSIGLRALCLFSLGTIPAYCKDELSLKARVEFKGQLLREYVYEDRVTIWAHLLLLPWAYTKNNAVVVHYQVQANILLHLIRDLRRDLPTLVPTL